MEKLIKKLLDIDKNAREKVDEALKRRSEVISDIDEKKEAMQTASEADFARELENKKAQAKSMIENEYSPEKVKERGKAVTDRLDAIYEENRDRWVEEIFERVITG